jgi:hypothetical protein
MKVVLSVKEIKSAFGIPEHVKIEVVKNILGRKYGTRFPNGYSKKKSA